MNIACRIGLHRWAFRSQVVGQPNESTRVEITLARCCRDGCHRYGTWSRVHLEPYQTAPLVDAQASEA